MPELPEVETVCRGLEPFMRGKTFQRVILRRKDLRVPFPKNLAERLEGRKVTNISRRAKYMLVHIAGNKNIGADILIVHLGMSGRMTAIPKGRDYTPVKHDHMILEMTDGPKIVFHDPRRFGMVMLTPEGQIETHKSFAHLGPEPLEAGFSKSVLDKKLKDKKANIKTALLDQTVVVGVGNIYASEALFDSGISPARPAGNVEEGELEDLVRAIKNVLRRAIKAGGSSLKDYKKADGTLGYFQHGFKVYDRECQPCPRCTKNGKKGHIIQKIVQSGRATYFCPRCQK